MQHLGEPSQRVDTKRLENTAKPFRCNTYKNQGATTALSIETAADLTCLQGNLLWFGGCGTALEFRGAIEFSLGSIQVFHFFVQLSQLIVRGGIIRRELHRFFQISLRVR